MLGFSSGQGALLSAVLPITHACAAQKELSPNAYEEKKVPVAEAAAQEAANPIPAAAEESADTGEEMTEEEERRNQEQEKRRKEETEAEEAMTEAEEAMRGYKAKQVLKPCFPWSREVGMRHASCVLRHASCILHLVFEMPLLTCDSPSGCF